MVSQFYDGLFAISLVLMIVYMSVLHRHFDTRITLIFALVPILNLGYALLGHAQTAEAALMVNRLTYIGGCYLQLILTLAVFGLCRIEVSRKVRLLFLALSTVVYLSSLTIGVTPLFYKSVTFERVADAPVFTKVYGPMHTVFIAMVLLYFSLGMGAIIYSYLRKNQVSRKNIFLLFLTEAVAMVCFFGGRMLTNRVEFLPLSYDIALVLYLIIIYRINLYDVDNVAIDSLARTGGTGLVALDADKNYLGSNEAARHAFPELCDLTVDHPLAESAHFKTNVLLWLDAFDGDESANEWTYETAGKVFRVRITHLYSGRYRRGYQLFITDDTERQRYVALLNGFNEELKDEVERKTAHIMEMHDKLILGMATMVESRDNSTGGHIRRTSEGVRLLVGEITAVDNEAFSERFCHDIVKAAPMHDLGKIAVDDAILRKPGRFTSEEFDKMKAHAAEGARIVHEILRDTDDRDFMQLAENVAHYHHERWDGSGYPEGLKGAAIPIEARIMAIADVYDALVSKRVYKERMSFERAHAIIMEGMGTQFDPALEPYYLRAKPRLEAYYSSLDANGASA